MVTYRIVSIANIVMQRDNARLISVGPRPRMNALLPSVRHIVLTQSRVDLYFCPVAGVKPSVCIRDLIMSIGYITAQSYAQKKEINIQEIIEYELLTA